VKNCYRKNKKGKPITRWRQFALGFARQLIKKKPGNPGLSDVAALSR
jgi:hypothetical protein